MPYLGKTPSQATRQRYYKTASGGETSISGTMTTGGTLTFNDGEFVDVSVNGVALVAGTDYNTTTANTIGGLSALSANDQVEIVVYDTFSVFSGDVDSNLSVGGNLSVSGTSTLTGNVSLPDNTSLIFGAGTDLTINHDGSNSFITDSGTGALYIQGTNGVFIRSADGGENLASFTDDGSVALNHDNTTRIETTSSGVDITGGFTATDGCTITTADNDAQLILKSTDTDSDAAPFIDLQRDSGSPADNDFIGKIRFAADDDAGNVTEFAQIHAQILDASNGSEDGALQIRTTVGGSVGQPKLDFLATETVFNEGSNDVDFRVESDNDTHALFVQGSSGNVGIGTSSPGHSLHLKNSNPTIRLEDSDGASNIYGLLQADGAGSVYIKADDAGNSGSTKIAFEVDGSERARIDSSGRVLIGTTSTVIDTSPIFQVVADQAANFQATVTTSGGTVLNVDRANADGNLIRLRQAGTTEGTISVSGSTVSYNGGHLSRWSQLTDGTEDLTIVKGTVMTNLDQMAVWSYDEVLWTADDELPDGVSVGDVKTAAYTEDNEQLNCMAVSSVEGDTNVAGVFVNWDNGDEDFNDMNVAMTGDMVIRIAQGTTVARGDLLMSAGDGTAKPQGDDIVRSKTIAKVISTNVSHTYNDGSYLVPCVLMAC
jgi:hypothetical protein